MNTKVKKQTGEASRINVRQRNVDNNKKLPIVCDIEDNQEKNWDIPRAPEITFISFKGPADPPKTKPIFRN